MIDERFCAIITDLTGAPTELVAADRTLVGYQQRTLWGRTLWTRRHQARARWFHKRARLARDTEISLVN